MTLYYRAIKISKLLVLSWYLKPPLGIIKMDWLDVCFLCLLGFLLLWFFEKLCVWGTYFVSRGKITIDKINLRGVHNVQITLKSLHLVANHITISYRKRTFIFIIDGLNITYHPLIAATSVKKLKAGSKNPQELRNVYLPSALYYIFKFIQFEITNIKISHIARSITVNLQHVILREEKNESPPNNWFKIVFTIRSIRISKIVAACSDPTNVFTCFELSLLSIFDKECFSFSTKYKLSSMNFDIKEPLISLNSILNVKSEASLYNSNGLKPKFKLSPELLIAFFHHNFIRQLCKTSKLPPVVTFNIHCFKLEDIFPDIESSLCTFSYMQATVTIIDKQTIHCNCVIPQFECHFVEKSVSTLLIQSFNLILDLKPRSVSARLGFAELDSQLHIHPDEDSIPLIDLIPVSLECSHSMEVSAEISISEKSYTLLDPCNKYSKQEFQNLDLDTKLSFKGFISDFNVTTYGSSESSPHFCLKEFRFLLNGGGFHFTYCLYIDVIKICSAPFVIDAFVQSVKRLIPRKRSASNVSLMRNGSFKGAGDEEQTKAESEKSDSHRKLKFDNEITSINVMKCMFLSDPDPGIRKVHKVSLTITEISRGFVDFAEFKFANLCLSVHHDDRVVNLANVYHFSLKEIACPWKSIDVKLRNFNSEWEPSSHMTVYTMVKCYASLKNSLKRSPSKVYKNKQKQETGSREQLVAWKVDSKMRKLPLISVTCKTFGIHAKTLDPSEEQIVGESFSNTFELTALQFSVSPSSLCIKCSSFNVFCDTNKIRNLKSKSNLLNTMDPKTHVDKVQTSQVDPIFTFSEFFLQYSTISSASTVDREKFSLSTKNHVITLDVDECQIKFPSGYVFHKNFSQLTLARKWLKALHYPSSSSNPTSSNESPVNGPVNSESNPPIKGKSKFVWPDFNFTLKSFKMSIDDSVFEKRLSENYRLLLDEQIEQMDRMSYFEKRWQEACLSNPPELCTDEVYEMKKQQLLEMNSKCYIDRWKSSRDYFKGDQNLVCMTMKNWQILCFADEEMTGRDNIIRHMNELDGTTTVPESIQFSAQACRLVSVSSDLFEIKIRDYPDPMYTVANGNISGKFLVAIPRPENSFSFTDYSLGNQFEAARLKRNPGSQKWFHNLTMTSDAVTFNWGQNRDPGWNEVSHGMSLINKPSADPSPSLPFWDKARLKCQGKFHCYYKSLEITWLCTLDPYKQSEKLRLLWNNVCYDWVPNNQILSGDLKVVIQTCSKAPLTFIHAPRTKMSWNFVYHCLGNPYAHHAVMFKPQNIYLDDYDTYSRFR